MFDSVMDKLGETETRQESKPTFRLHLPGIILSTTKNSIVLSFVDTVECRPFRDSFLRKLTRKARHIKSVIYNRTFVDRLA